MPTIDVHGAVLQPERAERAALAACDFDALLIEQGTRFVAPVGDEPGAVQLLSHRLQGAAACPAGGAQRRCAGETAGLLAQAQTHLSRVDLGHAAQARTDP